MREISIFFAYTVQNKRSEYPKKIPIIEKNMVLQFYSFFTEILGDLEGAAPPQPTSGCPLGLIEQISSQCFLQKA